MTRHKFAAPAAVAALTAVFVFGSTGIGEAKKAAKPAKDPAASFICPMEWVPVCGTVGGKKQTFGNACVAKQAGAKNVKKGACKK
jgi:hypothetical protein